MRSYFAREAQLPPLLNGPVNSAAEPAAAHKGGPARGVEMMFKQMFGVDISQMAAFGSELGQMLGEFRQAIARIESVLNEQTIQIAMLRSELQRVRRTDRDG
jgi:hypothetical protein